MTEHGWENHFAFKCFFFPTLVIGIKVLTSIRKLFEAYDHHVKAKYIYFFPQNVFYWPSLSQPKVTILRIQSGSCDCQSHWAQTLASPSS